MALVLLKPELDVWKPGQHNGTFRGHNLAFVAATIALNHYWNTEEFSNEIKRKSRLMEEHLQIIAKAYPEFDIDVRGRGFVWALESTKEASLAGRVQEICFEHKLIIETCGSKGQALKPMPALIATDEELKKGMDIIEIAYAEAVSEMQNNPRVLKLAAIH
jgi:diaminobutyrate-2-oxoglutarate transaminase